ncbi:MULTISPECIES: hypothetical protein [unclassified Bradyrhizobium]
MSAPAKRTALLFDWLNQVKRDRDLPASAFKVAFELGQWINGETFERDGSLVAWPSLETVGAAVMSERTARDMVKRLQQRGHLDIKIGRGPGHPSRYTLKLTNRQPAAAFDEGETGSLLPVSSEETGSSLPLSSEENRQDPAALSEQIRQDTTLKPAGYDTETGSRLPTNHLKPFLNHEGETRATLIPDDFRLSDENYLWALLRLDSDDAVRRSIDRFVNHYRQVDGPQAMSRDWQAKARNWVDEDARKLGDPRSRRGSLIDAIDRELAALDGSSRSIADSEWDDVLSTYIKFGRWTRYVSRFGPAPESPDCRAPQHLLKKHGLASFAQAAE